MKINNVEIKQLPEMNAAAFAHIGAYHLIGEAFERMERWASPRGRFSIQPLMIAIYHDDPMKVASEELRSDACLVVGPDTVIDGDARQYIVSGGKYLVINAEIVVNEFGEVWQRAYEIMREKGLTCDERDHYELYLNDPGMADDALFLIDICIPIN